MGHRDELLKNFGMGANDLALNRDGILAPPQVARLKRSGWVDVWAAVAVGVVLAGILYGVANKPLKPAQYITAAVLFGAALATGLFHFRKVYAAAADGRVERIAGAVRVFRQGKSGFYLAVNNRTFKLPLQPWKVQSGKAYQVYVAPRANLIVAMEPDGWDE